VLGVTLPELTWNGDIGGGFQAGDRGDKNNGVLAEGSQAGDRDVSIEEGLQAGVEPTLVACGLPCGCIDAPA
jgi:hypothetical protein